MIKFPVSVPQGSQGRFIQTSSSSRDSRPPVPPAELMSGFDLVPVDGGGPLHLPLGETVLGRGPLLGISDKRVSRHHGLMENLNGQLRVKPIHVNPCFVQAESDSEPRPLLKDCWYRLHHGDLLSLLPGRLVFRVEAVGGEEHSPRYSSCSGQMSREEEALPVPAGPGAEALPAAPAEGRRDEEKVRSPRNSLTEDVGGYGAPSAHRKRVLPAWMMVAVETPKTPSSTITAQSAVKTSKRPAAPPVQATPTVASSHEEAEPSEEEERPRKKRREVSDEDEEPPTKNIPTKPSTLRYQSQTSSSEVSNQSKMEVEADRRGEVLSKTSEVRKSKEEKKVVGPNPSKPVRSPCPYGKDCYRKNPLHFQECSHPGDADYQEEAEEDEADRPECPYGAECYRKNPLHRKEFKHTKRPARYTRTVARDTTDDDDEDDDGFINDDSEDGGNDSDYVPQASDDSDKEDVERLQREAQAFLKRKK